MRELLGFPQLKVAKYLNKDHTTIIYGIKEIENKIKEDPEFRIVIDNLKEDILN